MAQYFLKLSGSNNIENIIEWDGVSSYTPPTGYVLELVTTTASINYAPSASIYEDPVFGGKLFGQFEGNLTGSVTFNGETLPQILSRTPYGTVTLFTSSLKDVHVDSGSFKIEAPTTSSFILKLPLSNNQHSEIYSSSFARIINENIKNYELILTNKNNNFKQLKFLIESTEVTSSISGSVTTQYIKAEPRYITLIDTLPPKPGVTVYVGDTVVWKKGGTVYVDDTVVWILSNIINENSFEEFYIDINENNNVKEIIKTENKKTKYGSLLYNGHTNNTDPGAGYFSINSSTVWSEATELYVSLENYQKILGISESVWSLYQSTLNNLFYDKIFGSKIKLDSAVFNDNTYKLFQIQDIQFVTSSGDNYVKMKVFEEYSHTDGTVLLALGQEFNVDFELLNKKNRQMDIITGSKSFYTPYWAKDVIVMTIGAGGGGGGGITAKQNHQFAVGGAGGGGGSIAYREFNNLSGSIRIDCFIGKAGLGGVTGSSDVTASYGIICPTCDTSNVGIINNKKYIKAYQTESSPQTIIDILDLNVPTASFGYSGGSTFAYIYDKNNTSLLGKVSAPGGIGGSFGYSLGITGSISSSMAIDLIVSNSISPVSSPGGTNLNRKDFSGNFLYGGGPGGYGITLPISVNEKYMNFSPSLPWNTNEYLNQSQLNFPFGNSFAYRRTYGSNNNGEPIIIIRRGYVNHNGDPIILIKADASVNSPITGSYLSFDQPADIGITGGGGGNGWITSSLVSTSSVYIGEGGRLNSGNKIFEYELSTGGNGGNRSTLNGLSVQMPKTGSGPGAGGGGGASDMYGGTSQNGADGESGAVVIISIG